jgi:manganese transport protein
VADDLNHYLGDHAGTMSGQVVMAGFLRRQIPIFIRRAVTMLPPWS